MCIFVCNCNDDNKIEYISTMVNVLSIQIKNVGVYRFG